MLRFLPGFLFILLSSFAFGQGQVVKGKVTSATEPNGLPGVNVVVRGTSVGTITDANGEYSLEAPVGSIIAFSFVGYVTQEFTFNGQTAVNITLAEESTELTEVIVTGY